ncbi:MAG: ABC transporter ATP-binding protein, partial [Acidaminobacteraceae bacterium]
EIEKFEKDNDEYYEKTYGLIKMFAMYWSISDILCYFQVVLVLFFGTIGAVNGDISLGTLVAFISYESLLLWPVRQFGRVLSDLGKALVAVERINEILVEELDEDGEGIKSEVCGEIEFKNVSFAYDGKKDVLKDISFKIDKGMSFGIIGPTGSGKTSLIHLIARLYESTSGNILIDGVNIKEINKKWLRSKIDLVLQEPFLYTKTIKENIKISNENYTMHDVIEAAKTSAVHSNIIGFDKGYKTLVGEKGVSLSGGQRQRVAIARNVINHNPILIFDDSLSAVDTETDRLIRKQLKEKMSDVSTIIISHRISSIMDCDKILVLENGEISGLDTHSNLIKTNELYKNIWNIQNSAS